MKAIGIFFISLFMICSPANAKLTISELDPGGAVATYLRFWEEISKSNESVVIDAPCISACTLLLRYVPTDRICITPRASFGFHQAIDTDGNADPVFSTAFFRWMYPAWVQEWLKANGGLKEDPIYMYPEDMKGHIALCPGYVYGDVSPEELINHPLSQLIK